MNLSVSGHHLQITPAIRGYLQAKLERIARHFDRVIDAHVVLTVDKLLRKAEATVHVPGRELHCASEQQDLYAAIDLLADKLERRVQRYKNRLYDKRS